MSPAGLDSAVGAARQVQVTQAESGRILSTNSIRRVFMRKLLGLFAAGFIAMGAAGQAHAVALPYTGSLTISLAGNNVTLLSGGTAIVNGSGGAGHLTGLTLAASDFATTGFSLPVTPPAGGAIFGIRVAVANGPGAFAGSGGAGFGGTMPLNGVAKVCLFGTCSAAAQNLSVPLSNIGVGGTAVVTAGINVTVVGAPWTTGTAAIGTVTQMGGVSPLSNTGAPSGQITLVSPVFVSTSVGGSEVVPTFAILNLHFVPEPGTLVLLGSGIAGLVAFGRSRAR
jgi:hypothetical protein